MSTTHNHFEGHRRSEKWQIYLNGDKSMALKRQDVDVLSRGMPLPGIDDVGFDSSSRFLLLEQT